MPSLPPRPRLRLHWRRLLLGVTLAAAAALSGCKTIHSVKIDAINNPAKSLGTSYRLEMNDPSGSQPEEVAQDARVLVKSALAARGMYEAPPNGAAEMVITAEYGVGPGQMKIVYKPSDSSLGGIATLGRGSPKPILVFEKYIKLTAREAAAAPPEPRAGGRRASAPRGEELWSLTVSVEDEKKDLGPYLAVLASTSVDYIGANSGSELHVAVDASTAEGNLRRRSGQ
ncbi:MAG TPA: hypothetical protein VEB66_10750 [Opitutaceae bacterium]|nr:hypothetical protein [Opitutaceae bacterium]